MTVSAMIPALRAAADFFEANPDKRAIGRFAEDVNRSEVLPKDPTATCWCALGRTIKELDNDTYVEAVLRSGEEDRIGYTFAHLEYLLDGDTITDTWEHNDGLPLIEQTPLVVANLRAIADKLENA